MPSGFSLVTSNQQLRELLIPWLDGACLSLPAILTLKVEVGAVPAMVPHGGPVLTGGDVITYAAADGSLVIEWKNAMGVCSIAEEGLIANVILSEEALTLERILLRGFLLNACILLLRRVGLHHVHGATLIDPANRAWVLVGASRSGKSTTTARLARNGWKIGTDDNAFLRAGDAGGVDLVAWRERVALREHALTLAPYEGGVEMDARGKRGWFAEDLGADWVSSITPEIVAFPGVSGGSRTTLTAISKRDALTRVVTSSPWVMLDAARADEHLALITRLVTQARCYDLQLGRDIFDNPDVLMELTA